MKKVVDLNQNTWLFDVEVEGLGRAQTLALRFGSVASDQGQALNATAQPMTVENH
jgi:hypothetical protein